MDKIMVCPYCQGKKEISILNDEKFDKEGIVEWLEKPCSMCNGKGVIRLDPDELVKI